MSARKEDDSDSLEVRAAKLSLQAALWTACLRPT
ncbi:hypothetical protein JOD54_006330 [Actinokineospora baliensis]|nr:hypothetical protein [Actinokineospora baliensis]